MGVVDLSRGWVAAAISDHQAAELAPPALRPVLQVADVRLVPRSVTARKIPRPLYVLALSDGVHSLQGLLVSDLSHLAAADGAVVRHGTVLRLLDFVLSTVQGRSIFKFTEIEILQTDCALIGSPKLYEHGQHNCFPPTVLRPKVNGANNLSNAPCCGESHLAGQGAAAAVARNTIAEISYENLGCSDKQELINVKATLSFVNTENFCYAACPLVMHGRRCLNEVASSGNGWWYCHSCNQTSVSCDYRYRILAELRDSTGTTYAPASQEAGEDIFGCTAKELYILKYEKRDHAQLDDIVAGVLFGEYLFKLKLETGALDGNKFPKCTIVRAEKADSLIECRRLLRVINKHL